jgi:hypothetical protein
MATDAAPCLVERAIFALDCARQRGSTPLAERSDQSTPAPSHKDWTPRIPSGCPPLNLSGLLPAALAEVLNGFARVLDEVVKRLVRGIVAARPDAIQKAQRLLFREYVLENQEADEIRRQ